MILNELRPVPGSRKKRKRIGRGEASGRGGTAGKGHKGQRARSGGTKGPGFEGGQMPLQRRIPKRGFTNIFRTEYQEVNVSRLNAFDAGTEVTPELLRERRIIRKKNVKVKILGKGELKAALTVKAHAFSKSAEEKIKSAGGKVEVI